ncbi:GntR family transcriptional regulator [Azospirillum halopraeferens]|uniref:GntR family transcriptional regulator n=1 Tax=Azospirillum halopraeferens TaxID=34010 RepID=UPI000408C04A|nr:GntR family transcriptional regulator [Azospirillum halopraeferens]
MKASRERPAATPARPDVQEVITRRIADAIADRRLPPGTKLTEERLAAIFGVSRARVRGALATLSQRGIVTLRPNRGAFVATPSVTEAREVFEARRVVERGLVPRLCRNGAGLPPAAAARLRAHLDKEAAAEAAGDRKAMIRLSGEFHLLLADLAGNATLGTFLDGLVRRSSLVIAAYESRPTPGCSADEHRHIVDALAAGDGAAAERLMDDHLHAIEDRLTLEDRAADAIDLRAVFDAA